MTTREQVARAAYAILAENQDPDLVTSFDWDKGAHSKTYLQAVRIADAILALSPPEPTEGQTEAIARAIHAACNDSDLLICFNDVVCETAPCACAHQLARVAIRAMPLQEQMDICIDCEGPGVYPNGRPCKSCGGSGRVGKGDGIPVDSMVAEEREDKS